MAGTAQATENETIQIVLEGTIAIPDVEDEDDLPRPALVYEGRDMPMLFQGIEVAIFDDDLNLDNDDDNDENST